MALSEESFLSDGEDCAETWRQLRWPDGPECVECGSSEVAVRTTEYRDHLYRYECEECGRWFTDTSGTFIENANVDLPVWVYVIREMDKDRSINSIAKDLPHTYKTACQDGLSPVGGNPRGHLRAAVRVAQATCRGG